MGDRRLITTQRCGAVIFIYYSTHYNAIWCIAVICIVFYYYYLFFFTYFSTTTPILHWVRAKCVYFTKHNSHSMHYNTPSNYIMWLKIDVYVMMQMERNITHQNLLLLLSPRFLLNRYILIMSYIFLHFIQDIKVFG